MFAKQAIPLRKELINSLVLDYLSKSEKVKDLYSYYPDKQGFSGALKALQKQEYNRSLLVDVLLEQCDLVTNTSKHSRTNCELIRKNTTYTVTTGHQLCLFTGPVYFIYKIVSAINLCEKLKIDFPDYNFVPVYWMATEDHDVQEINHFTLFGKRIVWETMEEGAVGGFSTKGLEMVERQLQTLLGNTPYAAKLISLFNQSYLGHNQLADATRFLVNELFGKYGLVIVDGNNKKLKQSFIPYFEKDIFENVSYNSIVNTINDFEQDQYHVQVNPRAINCFYMEKGIRARIEKTGEVYTVIGTEIKFTKEELREVIKQHPEKISPNVVLRPCYQQAILPNLSYVGGPGELAYWLEYKKMFEVSGLFFPVICPRKFVTIMDQQIINKINTLKMEKENVFESEQEMIAIYLEKTENKFDVTEYKKNIEGLFKEISKEIAKVDKTLVASAEAEKQKSIKIIDSLEQKAIRAIKAKSENELNRIKSLKNKLFPGGLPQERVENFSEYYSKWGVEFMDYLKSDLQYNDQHQSQLIISEN